MNDSSEIMSLLKPRAGLLIAFVGVVYALPENLTVPAVSDYIITVVLAGSLLIIVAHALNAVFAMLN